MAQHHDMFLKIDKIDGESQDDKHGKEIDIEGWNWGMCQPGSTHTGEGGGTGKVEIRDLHVTKRVDRSTPILMKFCAEGAHIAKAILVSRKAGGSALEFIILTMEDVFITNVDVSHQSGSETTHEEITINFGKFNFEYTPQDTKSGAAQGKIPFGYDIRKRKTC